MADPRIAVGQYIGARKAALDTPALLVDLDALDKGDKVVFTLAPAGKGQQVTSIRKQ